MRKHHQWREKLSNMQPIDANLETFKEYLAKKYKINSKEITLGSSLLYDLEFKGDDIDEFFSFLINDFKIDVKQLNLSRFYVGDEPFDFISPLIRVVKRENVYKKPTLTINDILKFIHRGILE